MCIISSSTPLNVVNYLSLSRLKAGCVLPTRRLLLRMCVRSGLGGGGLPNSAGQQSTPKQEGLLTFTTARETSRRAVGGVRWRYVLRDGKPSFRIHLRPRRIARYREDEERTGNHGPSKGRRFDSASFSKLDGEVSGAHNATVSIVLTYCRIAAR